MTVFGLVFFQEPPQPSVYIHPSLNSCRSEVSQLGPASGMTGAIEVYKPPPQGFFQGFFRAVKLPQKLNLELSFETQSSHQSFSAVKMKLFELNL